MNDGDLRRVAYHEAAHAVASFRAGGIPSITLVPTEHALGACTSDELDKLDDRTYVRVCLAGPAMDLERGLPDVREDAWTDFDLAEPFISQNGWNEAELLSDARTWVRSEMPAITAVAERLLVDRKLTEGEIAILIGAADGEDLEAPLEHLLRLARRR